MDVVKSFRSLREGVDEQAMILSRVQPSHANEKKVVWREPFSLPTVPPIRPGTLVGFNRNAIWDEGAILQPVHFCQARRDFLGDGDRFHVSSIRPSVNLL